MTIAKKGIAALIGAVMVAMAAMALVAVQPQTADAKTITGSNTYIMNGAHSGGSVTKVTSKKIVFKGTGYKGKNYKSISGTFTFKINSKTKYYSITDTDKGKADKLSKKSAHKTLKKGNFISAQIVVKSGKVKKLTFGAF